MSFFAARRFEGTDGSEKRVTGGEGGIRTLDTRKRIHTFQACSFSHSDTSPEGGEAYTSRVLAAIRGRSPSGSNEPDALQGPECAYHGD